MIIDKKSLVIGLIAGLLLGGVTLLAGRALRARREVPRKPPFTVEKQAVRIDTRPGTAGGMVFETAQVVAAPALPRPPVTARVTVLESRTSASYAPLEGRVERVTVVLGDHVRKGQRLVLVRSGDLASMVRELRGDLVEAQTKKMIYERTRQLVTAHAASPNEMLVAGNEYEAARLASVAAGSRLRSLAVAEEGDNLYWIVAGRTGTVVQVDAQPGQRLGPGRERPAVEVAELDEVLVFADVAQRDVAGLAPGTPVRVHLTGQAADQVQGHIDTVSEVLDPERQTVPVRIRVNNDKHLLRPNAFVEAVFVTGGARTVLEIPNEAIVSDGLDSVVFVESEAGLFHRREIGLGRQGAERSEVVSGLRAGERVVTRGALLLLNAIDLER